MRDPGRQNEHKEGSVAWDEIGPHKEVSNSLFLGQGLSVPVVRQVISGKAGKGIGIKEEILREWDVF